MYGGDKTKIDSSEHYKGIDLENIFSRALINSALNFSKFNGLSYSSVKDALKNEERLELLRGEDPNTSPRKFETALLVESYKLRTS